MAVVELLGISMKIPAITHQLLRKKPIHSSFNQQATLLGRRPPSAPDDRHGLVYEFRAVQLIVDAAPPNIYPVAVIIVFTSVTHHIPHTQCIYITDLHMELPARPSANDVIGI